MANAHVIDEPVRRYEDRIDAAGAKLASFLSDMPDKGLLL
jgi:hypothetical protein